MNAGNNQNTTIKTTTISKPESILAAHLTKVTSPIPAPTSQLRVNLHTDQTAPAPVQNSDTFLSEGKSTAITINTPFTAIPGLPALNKILAKIDKTTQQDLGFTFKGSAAKTLGQHGEQDLQVTIDYIGFGLMSSKFNVQFSPVSIKVESGGSNLEPHWGCSASVLSSPIGLIHERAGVKGTFSDCNSTRTFSAAPEISYQSSNKFKTLSTATGGYFFGDKATFRIPAEYVPTMERIKAASPDMEEWKMITDHIAPSIPAIQIGRLIDQNIEIAGNVIKSVTSMAESAVDSTAHFKIDHTNNLPPLADTQPSQSPAQPSSVKTQGNYTNSAFADRAISDSQSVEPNTTIKTAKNDQIRKNQAIAHGIEPSIEEKANYTVQLNDTLAMIGKKTGHPWTEIYALNKNTLKNNPDKIYPGQELLIPDPHDHAALISHPVVQARILANIAKQQLPQPSEHTR